MSTSSFEERKQAAEAKFAHDQELAFKARARRNKKVGLWAAGMMGLAGADAQTYAQAIIKVDFVEPGDEDIFRKLRSDFDAKNVSVSDHQIRRTLEELLVDALEEIQQE
ncbi:MAG: DUF1476 domain-containing protein [Alphaproteobacteria bacterium]